MSPEPPLMPGGFRPEGRPAMNDDLRPLEALEDILDGWNPGNIVLDHVRDGYIEATWYLDVKDVEGMPIRIWVEVVQP